jgi:disulfide bond formation protein DsbB
MGEDRQVNQASGMAADAAMGRPAWTRVAALLLAAISAATLLAVFAIQYLGGYAPCPMCLWQRWPYAALILLGGLGWYRWPRPMLTLALPVLLVSAGLAGYHVAVEQGWVALPAGCAAGGTATTIEDLRRLLAEAPPACDQVGFTVLGLSHAAWNLVLSMVLAAAVAAILLRRAA